MTVKMRLISRMGLVLVFLLAAGAGMAFFIFDKPLPQGKEGEEADRLARKMLNAIRFEAWDTTRFVQWSMMGHQYLWDKKRNLVKVEWGNRKVLLNANYGPENPKGEVWRKGKSVESEKANKDLQKALKHFYNDSFWLNAPAKIFDKGTKREIVELDNEEKGLLITYMTGGVTPGDSYLWLLEDNGLPYAFKMWVSVIPIGGLKATWENWKELSTGAKIATKHRILIFSFSISNLKAGQSLEGLGIDQDPFLNLRD